MHHRKATSEVVMCTCSRSDTAFGIILELCDSGKAINLSVLIHLQNEEKKNTSSTQSGVVVRLK